MSGKTWTKLILFVLLVLTAIAGYFLYLNRNAIDSVPKLDFENNPEITKGHDPKICSAISSVETNRGDPVFCPPHSAFMTAEDLSPTRFGDAAASAPLKAVCCELPATDILTNEHVYNVSDECPASYIATGTSGNGCGDKCFFRCTRINTDRYSLGKKHQGLYWKRDGTYPAAGRGGAAQILLSEIPQGLLYADGFNWEEYMGRDENPWDKDGCIGAPFGSVLVEKRGQGCGGFYFRPILFKSSMKAIRSFLDCDEVAGIEERKPYCKSSSR